MKEDNKEINFDEVTIEEIKADETQSSEHGDHHHHSEHHSHHHSGHGHHSHHHRRGHSSKKKNSKFSAFMKKYKSVLINIVSCTVSVALLIVMASTIDFSKKSKEEFSVQQDITQSTVKIETPIFSEKIPLVNSAIFYYLNSENESGAVETYKLFDGHKTTLNVGLPVNLTYSVAGIPNGIEVASAELELSEYSDYKKPTVYNLDTDDTDIDIFNLKTGTKYYYRVNYTLNNGSKIGTLGSFETEKSPRIMNIGGAVNVRDIGGWTTDDGKTVKQGLLYRGSELDGAVKPEYNLTESGREAMLWDLGIRFDMDLRSAFENTTGEDALGKGVKHIYYGIPMYSEVFKEENNEAVRSLFSELSDENNYPIYMHCTYGLDRTGTICYLLEALLGVQTEYLHKDYELSAFTHEYINPAFTSFVEQINTMKGNTVKEKVEGYLLSIGVTSEEIANIREIFLEASEK